MTIKPLKGEIMDNRIEKLPVWAKELIVKLERQRNEAVEALKQYVDTQTKSAFRVVDNLCIGPTGNEKSSGPQISVRYVDTHRMSVVHDGIVLDVLVPLDRKGIELKWGEDDGHLSSTMREVAFIPTSFQSARIMHPKDIR